MVGRPHAVFGEEPVACVALRDGASVTPHELIDLCSGSLAWYKVPRDVIILDALPKNAVGKIAKPVLQELVAEA